MGFRPNMTNQEIFEEDSKRGHKTMDVSSPPAVKGVDSPEGAMEGDEEGESAEGEEEEDLSFSIIKASCPVHKPGECPDDCPQEHGYAHMKDAKKSLHDMVELLKAKSVTQQEETEKALSTRSMHIPRPTQPYDPFKIQSSAVKATTRGHSKLRGPEGVAPLVGETFAQLAEDEKPRTEGVTYKSCAVHGLSYRSDTGCYPCALISKSLCKCGAQMFKTAGGGMSCPTCG